MNVKEAKEELNSLARLKAKSEQLGERIEALQEKAKSAGVQNVSGMPSGKGMVKDLSDTMVAIEEMENRRKELNSKTMAIENRIALVEDSVISKLLKLRYQNEMSWREVAKKMDRSTSWAEKMNKKAIEAYAHVNIG